MPRKSKNVIVSFPSTDSQANVQPVTLLQGEGESTEKRLNNITEQLGKAVREIGDTKNLTVLGFYVLLTMVATLIVMVLTMFIDALKEQKPTIIYQVTGQLPQQIKTVQ